MAKSILEIDSFLPPLLEQQMSPPYKIVARHLDYLQRWREYLLCVWTGDSNNGKYKTDVQKTVDDLMSIILLFDFVRQTENTAIPSIEEVLSSVRTPTAYNLCRAVNSRISCSLLKCIFNPDHFCGADIGPKRKVNWSSLTYICDAADAFYGSRMPITILGDFHQLCVDYPVADRKAPRKSTQRHNKGIHYTAAPLVDYIVFQTLTRTFHKLEPLHVQQLRILDPSCGCGAFLIAAFRYVLAWFKNQYSSEQQSLSLNPQEILGILESMIFGIDMDERAIEWTRRLLLLSVWIHCMNSAVSNSDIYSLNCPNLSENIICTDFLRDHSIDSERPPLMDKPFNVIIGGPPFVRVQELYKSSSELADGYKRRFQTARPGQFDLYMLFIEKSIGLLADEGYLSMSVSSSFLRSQTGHTLRKLIVDICNVNEIVEFEDSKLYPDANVPITLLLLRKTSDKCVTKHIYIKGKGGLRRKLSRMDNTNDPSIRVSNLPGTACASANWMLIPESRTDLLLKIESTGIPLSKLPIQIQFGIATGADDVFLLRNMEDLDSQLVLAESRFLNDIFVFESSVLRPILRGRHIREYATPEPKTRCIFPYDNDGRIISENVFRTEFPRTYRYLLRCRERLDSRKSRCTQPWYAFRSEDICRIVQSPKLVASVVNSGGGFTVDEHSHILCNNSVVVLRPNENFIDIYLLLGILNSSLFKMWVQHCMPPLGSGWYCYRINMLARFPIPVAQSGPNKELSSEISNLTRKLLYGKSGNDNHPEIMSSINLKVSKLYGISELSVDGQLCQ